MLEALKLQPTSYPLLGVYKHQLLLCFLLLHCVCFTSILIAWFQKDIKAPLQNRKILLCPGITICGVTNSFWSQFAFGSEASLISEPLVQIWVSDLGTLWLLGYLIGKNFVPETCFWQFCFSWYYVHIAAAYGTAEGFLHIWANLYLSMGKLYGSHWRLGYVIWEDWNSLLECFGRWTLRKVKGFDKYIG